MKNTKLTLIFLIISQIIWVPISASAVYSRSDDRQESRNDSRTNDLRVAKTKHIRKGAVVVVPRKRSYRNIVIVRPHGHAYVGYGHYHSDNDAWKWLAFTAITLKALDNLDEQAQREHESAQVKATTSAVGEKISWETEDSSGTVVTTKKGESSDGLTCREFQQEITVGGKTEQAFGTACLQADGVWKIV